ncbi:hypothetical protein EG68_07183 [Paragonimus skrjabini miyazakii]|uniref:Inositol hexakisphosphate and diphosphoinositol-pentakisphosphate kinase n=1 Tax=Paragonimus skrjabini miyazakii TaxID=59628 RepID=A0A8S9YW89_9TREM|nr:hypothetical protein EG68_07183 [Paragonimus skrjabini miyazakii]
MTDTNNVDADVIVRIGVCAMAKKAMSKPMKEILRRMDKFQHIRLIVFEENVILNEPIESWPICDALVSFYSEGFPLEKAIAYSKLRKPYLVNDLESQYILMDRRLVYECLKREGVPVPRYACVSRKPGSPPVNVVESDDSIEIDGKVFHKPFVEKPLNAEDHNVYIYFPSSAGGGSQRLFRKVGNLSSKYFPHSNIRTNGSYMYEEFMPTDGTDVKVYTVADDYAHAEARKSPALDGKVERDHEGKEVRYPVILTPREKILAKKVAKAVQQQICGFDLLRANGMSYVCDVNGFSFVKSSKKYYDDCSHILGVLITRRIAPRLCVPAYLPPGTDVDTPLVPTTCGTIMELRCVIAVIRHGDRTPKQKMKMEVRHEKFFSLFSKYAGEYANELKLKRPTQLQEVLDIVRCILEELETSENVDPQLKKNKAKFEQLKYVLEMYGSFSGINRKIQLKYHPCGVTKSSKADLSERLNSGPTSESKPSLLLVVKWGGELTAAGKQQAETLGRAFRCIYPGGDGHYGKDPGLGLLRLHSTYRHDLKIYASDEGRVQMTAAAFAKGFLALEGELPPILVQMVKSANTNGLLDNDNDCRHYQHMVKHRIKEVMSKATDFTQEDIQTLVPTESKSLVNAMRFVGNPRTACDRLFAHVKKLDARLLTLATSQKTRNAIKLYQGESWELLLRRWGKLWKDFRNTGDVYDLSKISDIYDNIKYDLQHNPAILVESEAQDFFMCAKSLADIVVPQEYGITREEKLVIGQRICTPLMRKILSDARYTDVDECTRLHAGYSKGVASPERFVRTRLYFTSESHLHSLLTCLRYGDLADVCTDEQWRRAMDYVSSVSEINYLAQIVIMIYEDPTVEPKTEKRFHVELHFSPGAFALCHDLPEGTGFRPGKLERLNSQASVVSSAASGGKGSTESMPNYPSTLLECGSAAPSGATGSSHMNENDHQPGESGITSIRCKRPSYPAELLVSSPETIEQQPQHYDTLKKHPGLKPVLAGSDSNAAPEYSSIAERLQHLKFWRDSVVLTSTVCTTATTTTGSASEDEEAIPNDTTTLEQLLSNEVPEQIESRPLLPVLDDALMLPTGSQTRAEGINLESMTPASIPIKTADPTLLSDGASKGVGIGRFIITRSVADQEPKLSPALAKSVVTLPSDNNTFSRRDGSGAVGEGGVARPLLSTGAHFGRSMLPDLHTTGRLTVSCSPDRYRCASVTELGLSTVSADDGGSGSNSAVQTVDPSVSSPLNRNCPPEIPDQLVCPPTHIRPSFFARSGPLTKWLMEQAATVPGKEANEWDYPVTTLGEESVPNKRIPVRRHQSHPRSIATVDRLCETAEENNPNSSYWSHATAKCLQPTNSKCKPTLIIRENPALDDMSILTTRFPPRLRRCHSTGSIFPCPHELFLHPTEYIPSPLRLPWLRDVCISPPPPPGPESELLDRVPSLPELNKGSNVLGPDSTICRDAMLNYTVMLDDRATITVNAETDPMSNQALNALTYPSHQSPYNLDIERLVRAVALGAPVPRPFCRSLISTAVIRGSRDDGQACSSVPDIKRLMDDCNVIQKTPTPGSSNDFFVPSAPCVPEVYPLETLHNALTLSQLEAFFARLTTHKFPTPFTSPQHPSTPVTFYDPHHHHHSHHNHYHDSATSLVTAFPSPTELYHSEELLTGSDVAYTGGLYTNVEVAASLDSGGKFLLERPPAAQERMQVNSVFRLVTVRKQCPSATEDITGTCSDTALDSPWHSEDVKTHSVSIEETDAGKSN